MLPDLIEIAPLRAPVGAEVSVPGSKSITNRALILAALADGEVTLRGALWSEDTQVMTAALRELGFDIEVAPDKRESCNRLIRVRGHGGRIPKAGTAQRPLELFVGNAGTAARFLSALVCLGHGAYALRGAERMHQRPQRPLFNALRELGYRVDSDNGQLPALIFGVGPRHGHCRVTVDESSQFASALLLCAEAGGWEVEVVGENAEETSYVAMTRHLIAAFPRPGGDFQIEPDASSASYFLAANWLLQPPTQSGAANPAGPGLESPVAQIRVAAYPTSTWQIDAAFSKFLPLPESISRQQDLGDSIMTAMVLAPFAERPTRFTGLDRLRVQECERVAAMRAELTRCGARVIEEGQMLTVYPAPGLHGAEIETYDDHRLAMCFAILGLKVAGIRLKNPACVKKTFPDFFQKLAGAPPGGLGVHIFDCGSGQRLNVEQLFAGGQ